MSTQRDRRSTTDARSRTHLTLVRRLASSKDKDAWREFEKRYGPRILRWCRAKGLQSADAEDVSQNVLFKLARQMGKFEYDPSKSFRAWLKTITNHALIDALKKNQRALELLNSVAAQQDLFKELRPVFDRELLDEAMARAETRVAPTTWEAFRLSAIDGLSAAEAAERLGVPEARVRVQRGRVAKLIREEIKKLRGGAD